MTATFPRFAAALAALALTLAPAAAMAQAGDPDALRATGLIGEQANGRLGVREGAQVSEDLRRSMAAVNLKREDLYRQLATQRGVTAEDVAGATACQLLANSVDPGEWWRDEAGQWRQRQGSTPVPLPSFCPR